MTAITQYLGSPTASYQESAPVTIASLTANIGDTVSIMPVQAGWIIRSIDVIFTGTASSTLSIGDSTSATRFVNAASTASTGNLTSGPVNVKYTGADTIYLTLGGANVAAKAYTAIVNFQRVYQ